MFVRFIAIAASAVALAACTSSSSSGGPSASHAASSPAAPTATAPINTGPTTAAGASSCPLVATGFVHTTTGLRLGRITVLKSGGHIVGCRFYALEHPDAQCDATCLQGEHLPGPSQPVVEITTRRYRTAVDAHNAFVLVARKGRNAQQADLGGGNTGVCFQTAFYPADHGADWACAASKATTGLLVRTVVTSPALDAQLVTQRVLGAI